MITKIGVLTGLGWCLLSVFGCQNRLNDTDATEANAESNWLKNSQEHIKYLKIKAENQEWERNLLQSIDSLHQAMGWAPTTFGLWRSNQGDIAFQTQEMVSDGIFITHYLTQLCCEGQPLKEVVDTATFQVLGASFFKDKQHVYRHFPMSDGGNFAVLGIADPNTFRTLGDCYAKDKRVIYMEKGVLLESVDYASFRTCSDCGCFAKDKNGYFHWDERLDTSGMDSITRVYVSRLDNL